MLVLINPHQSPYPVNICTSTLCYYIYANNKILKAVQLNKPRTCILFTLDFSRMKQLNNNER
jgi:hypothetical protein